jgi:gliding motility-associated-like protein
MKKHFLAWISFLGVLQISAQAPVNYEFQILEFSQIGCGDGVGNDSESTWKLWFRDNTMGGTWQLGDCHFTDGGIPNIFQPTINNYSLQSNTTATTLDIRFDAWEDDCDGGTGPDRCTFNSSCLFGTQEDDDRENWNPYIGTGGPLPSINFRDSSYCEWHIHEYTVGCFTFKFRFKWEYATISAGLANVSACGNSIQLNAFGSGSWSVLGGGVGAFVDEFDPTTTFTGTTGQLYTLQWGSLPGCLTNQTSTTNVNFQSANDPNLVLLNTACEGGTQNFTATNGGTSYSWSEGTLGNVIATNTSNQFSYSATTSPTEIFVSITYPNGCVLSDSVTYTLLSSPEFDLGNDTTICTGASLIVNATNQVSELTNYIWNTGSSSSVLTITNPGMYICTLQNLNLCQAIDTIIITNHPISPLDLGANQTYCLGNPSILLNAAQSPFVSYLWSDGSTFTTLSVNNFGTYYIDAIDNNGCTSTDTIVISPNYTAQPFFSSADTTITLGNSITLTAPSGVAYEWGTGETTQSITLSPTEYSSFQVTVEQANGCFDVYAGNIIIDPNPTLFVPNLFTPNGDGSNDVLLIYGGGIENMNFKIYNRWGAVVFESNSYTDMQTIGWDGKFNNEDQPEGVYVWVLSGNFINQTVIQETTKNTGSILLKR